jgi:hypothetical protein
MARAFSADLLPHKNSSLSSKHRQDRRLRSDMFARLICWYYWRQANAKYKHVKAFSVKILTPRSTIICELVQKYLEFGNRRMSIQIYGPRHATSAAIFIRWTIYQGSQSGTSFAPGSSFSRDMAILTEDFGRSLQPHYANDRVAPQIRPRPLPSTRVLIHYSLNHPLNWRY